MELGERIKSWLRLRGLRQSALAKHCGVTRPAVTAWLKHNKPPSQKNLQLVVEFLGLTMAEFYGAMPERPRAAA